MTETPTLDTSLAELVGKAAEALEKATATYGPDAVDLALEVGQIAAIRTVLEMVVLSLVGAALLFCTFRFAAKGIAEYRKDKCSDNEMPWFIATFFFGVAGVLTSLTGLTDLLQIHAWVGMFRPEIYLAYEAIF